jgi:hypothetical protein
LLRVARLARAQFETLFQTSLIASVVIISMRRRIKLGDKG